MPGPTDLRVIVVTTSTKGRFALSGDNFQLVVDGSLGTGGPGVAAGAMHLLAGSLATCAINVLRGAVEPDLDQSRNVSLTAHLQRGETQDRFALNLDARVDAITEPEAERLKQLYIDNCSIYAALKDALDITVHVRPA